MSIRDEINAHLDQGIFFLAPLILSDQVIRELFVSREVLDAVSPPFPENWNGQQLARFRAYLDAFTSGEEIGLSEQPFNKRADTFMARVHPVDLHVWDIRIIEPKPGIRCFGCFGDIDLFIALIWDYRENIEETADGFAEMAMRCRSEWFSLFVTQPYDGLIDDLISINYDFS